MPEHRETKILPYTPQQMYALVADVARYPEFLPWCTGARIIRQEPGFMLAELTIGYKMIREKFVSRVTLDDEQLAIHVSYVSGPLQMLHNEWYFTDTADGQCKIDFFVNFEFSSRILSSLMEMFFDVAFRRMVDAFEKRAGDVYS